MTCANIAKGLNMTYEIQLHCKPVGEMLVDKEYVIEIKDF